MTDEKEILIDLSGTAIDVDSYELASILEAAGVEEAIDFDDLSVSDEMKALFENELHGGRSELNLALANLHGDTNKKEDADKEIDSNHNGLALVPTKRTAPEEMGQTSLVPALMPAPEKHVIVFVAGTRYAVPMSHILEVGELGNFTPVPNVPDWIMGVTNLRGDIISVVNFRSLLGADPEDPTEARDLLVAQTLEADITVCLAVERVTGIASIPPNEIQTIDAVIGDKLTPYTRGVYTHADELLSILNLEGILRSLDLSYAQK